MFSYFPIFRGYACFSCLQPNPPTTKKNVGANACGSQLGREKLPEFGLPLLQEGVFSLPSLFREVEQTCGVTGQLHHPGLAVFICVEGGLEARDGRGAVGDYTSAPLDGLLQGRFIAPRFFGERRLHQSGPQRQGENNGKIKN